MTREEMDKLPAAQRAEMERIMKVDGVGPDAFMTDDEMTAYENRPMYRVREAHGSQCLGWNGQWDQEQFAGEWDERGLKAWVAKQLADERGEPELCYVGDEPNDFTFAGCDAVALIERV